MEIRKATIEDLDEFLNLLQGLFLEEHENYDKTLDLEWTFGGAGKKYFEEQIGEKDCCVFVAEEDEKLVGYLTGMVTKGEDYQVLPKTVKLDSLFVLQKYQRRGIGKRLYEAFVSWGKDLGAKRKVLEVYVGNEKAIEFYRKVGFEDYILDMAGEI